ncbi:PhnD/SsuA/transferrin family substrate-binding protein [Tritonibacter horizontis]|uniref:Phosphate-import protein PhnD n=1 Tax=Tritonibacter horizontis TaxID=1768241 RepID=A0A132BU36_9RHOB|nr:PhnD/SsuA/transferrin family substrate-binding protein [Tritonibacter horizontis]KUP91899.1 phosphate-import protein PhnD precursor [Tritonibacter horizontis]
MPVARAIDVGEAQKSVRFIKVLAFGALLALAALGPGSPARAEIELVFGTYAADKPSATVRKYRPFLTFLENRMEALLDEEVTIRLRISKDYEGSIADLANGVVDFARFGPASYIHAMDQNAGISIIAMESKKGEKRFKGVIAVHRDSDIHQVEDLAGLSFAFGDELSTIGRYLSQTYLLEANIDGQDLHGFEYLGRHDLVGEAVGAGKFSAGALKESTFKELVAKGVPIRSLVSFDNVTKPWLARADLDPRVLNAMRQVMLSSKNEEMVKRVAKNGFLAGTDSDYDFVRQAMIRSRDF